MWSAEAVDFHVPSHSKRKLQGNIIYYTPKMESSPRDLPHWKKRIQRNEIKAVVNLIELYAKVSVRKY